MRPQQAVVLHTLIKPRCLELGDGAIDSLAFGHLNDKKPFESWKLSCKPDFLAGLCGSQDRLRHLVLRQGEHRPIAKTLSLLLFGKATG